MLTSTPAQASTASSPPHSAAARRPFTTGTTPPAMARRVPVATAPESATLRLRPRGPNSAAPVATATNSDTGSTHPGRNPGAYANRIRFTKTVAGSSATQHSAPNRSPAPEATGQRPARTSVWYNQVTGTAATTANGSPPARRHQMGTMASACTVPNNSTPAAPSNRLSVARASLALGREGTLV